MSDFEKPRTPEEIKEIHRKRNREETELYLEGARDDESGRLVVTKAQLEYAKQEMRRDSERREQEELQLKEKISGIENVLGPVSEESKDRILQDTIQKTEKGEERKATIGNGKQSLGQKTEIRKENLDKNDSVEATLERFKSAALEQDIRRIVSLLRDREERRFNPIIDSDAIRRFTSAAGDLESARTIEDISASISNLTRAVRSIGEVPRAVRVRDDIESLKKLSWALSSLADGSGNLRGRLGALEDKNIQEILAQFRSLEGVLSEKRSYIIKKANALENFR